MSLLCMMFGHRPAFGYGNSEGNGYFDLVEGTVDGIGRHHAHLYCECERCGMRYHVGKVHLPRAEINAAHKRIQELKDTLGDIATYPHKTEDVRRWAQAVL